MSGSQAAPESAPQKKSSPKPFPRGVGGYLLWIGVALALTGYVSMQVYLKSQAFKIKHQRWAVSEARTTLAGLRAAEESYRAEHGRYLSSTTSGERDLYPPPGPEPQRGPFQPRLDRRPAWVALAKAVTKKRPLFCGYVVVAGPAGSLAKAGPVGRALFDHKPPNEPWYYALARCRRGEGEVIRFATTSASPAIIRR